MSFIDNIANSPIIKNALLKGLKKMFTEDGHTLITIDIGDDQELRFLTYKEPMKIVPKTKYDQLLKQNIDEV